jgi:DNA-binding MarR family transcriptional regulator
MPDRATLLRELLDEMTSHAPAKQMHMLRHWPSGRLSLVHLNVLVVLDAEGPLPMRALAEALDVSQASATGIIDRMEQRGLVTRDRDAEDRRVVRVALTDQGRELIAGTAAERRDHLARMLDLLTDDEIAGFLLGARALRRIREEDLRTQAEATQPEASRPVTTHPVPEASR